MSTAPLFQFKAGRVEFDESTGQATPIAGQGNVSLLPSSEDPSLLALQWQPRGSNNNATQSEELLLVPGDVEFTHSPHCQTGRVIQMKFNSSGERHLYWLQEASKGDLHEFSAEDENVLKKLNELANSMDLDEENEENTMQEEAPEQESTPSTSHNDTPQSALYSALAERIKASQQPNVPLSRVLSQSDRAAYVREADESQIQELLQHTAGLASNREELIEVVTSPYFAQSLDEIGLAASRSTGFSHEIGLSRLPQTSEDLLKLLHDAKQAKHKRN